MPKRLIDRRRERDSRQLVLKALRSLAQSLLTIKKQIKTISVNTDPASWGHGEDTRPPSIQVDVQFPESIGTYYDSKNNEAKRFNWKFWIPVSINFLTLL